MSEKNKDLEVLVDESGSDIEDDDFEEGDYGFILDPNGELKYMMFPEDLMEEPPLKVKRILKIFGIKDIHDLNCRTIH